MIEICELFWYGIDVILMVIEDIKVFMYGFIQGT